MKTCTKCGENKQPTEFYKEARNSDGLRSWCKPCVIASTAAWSTANPEKEKAKAVAYRAANLEKMRAHSAEWRAAHPEKAKASRAAYVSANKEKLKADCAVWKKNNKEKCAALNRNRRARKRKAGGTHTAQDIKQLFDLQRGKCGCCKTSIKDDYHVDHVIPLVLGGSNDRLNLQLLCPTCNLRKSAKHPIDFMQQQGYLL